MPTIHKGHNFVDDAMRAACLRVLDSHKYYLGSENDAFEQEVAAFLGVKHAVTVNSGSSALFLILHALDIGVGDEVIVQSSGFVTLAEAVANAGAHPRFIDVELETYNLDPDLLEQAYTPRVKAIVPAHTYGHPAAMSAIRTFAARHDLYIIEDCCHAFGAAYDGVSAGNLGDAAFLSFAGKGISVCGLGGMALTNDDVLAEEIRLLRDHGRPRSADGARFYDVTRIGYNLRLSELHAALGRVQLEYLSDWNDRRRANAQLYNDLFDARGVPVFCPRTQPGSTHAFLHYTLRVDATQRDALRSHLAAHGIESTILYPVSQHLLPPYQALLGHPPEAFPKSVQMTAEIVSLPNHPSLTADDVRTVADAVTAFFDR
jgi:dTDP-4-amino-4,6-dideoxygalactose transaminase